MSRTYRSVQRKGINVRDWNDPALVRRDGFDATSARHNSERARVANRKVRHARIMP